MADTNFWAWNCTCDPGPEGQHWWYCSKSLTPSADVPVCRDEDPAQAVILDGCYPPGYQHPEDDPPERKSTKWTGDNDAQG